MTQLQPFCDEKGRYLDNRRRPSRLRHTNLFRYEASTDKSKDFVSGVAGQAGGLQAFDLRRTEIRTPVAGQWWVMVRDKRRPSWGWTWQRAGGGRDVENLLRNFANRQYSKLYTR
jgi:hypothetical protein